MKQTFLLKRFFCSQKAQQVFLSFVFILAFNIIIPSISAQDITFNVKSYKGGYNVSCNGSTDGNIDATIVGGIAPYSYAWSNGTTTQDLANIGAGIYTLTVTDGVGSTKSKSITLFEADLIEAFLNTSLYDGGYHISKMGFNDGSITTEVKGGAPPYKYLWNTGSQKANLDKLTAGVYSVVVTDQNGCSVTKSVTLIEPTPLTLALTATTYGSYNTSCFESKDGSINLSVSGGMPPYKYNWNNGSFEEDLSNIPAGEYKVLVTDANKGTVVGQIILTQPNKLEVNLTVSNYSNGYNISCTNCFNGSITTLVSGGTSPSTYLWKGSGAADGQTAANLINLGPGGYYVLVTDANSCKTEGRAFLSEPSANAWDKNGNTVDNTNFLGTTNNFPLVIKTNNVEKLRITETGNIGIGTASPAFKLDVNGDLKATSITTSNINTTDFNVSNLLSANNIKVGRINPVLGDSLIRFGDSTITINTLQNRIIVTPSGIYQGLSIGFGTIAKGLQSLVFGVGLRTGTSGFRSIVMGSGGGLENNIPQTLMVGFNSNVPTLFVSASAGPGTTGAVAIGNTYIPNGYKLAVEGKIICEEVSIKLRASWPDYVFDKNYILTPLEELEKYINLNKHLPEIPSAKEIEKDGINTSEMITKLLKNQEELILYIIEQNKKIEYIQKQLDAK